MDKKRRTKKSPKYPLPTPPPKLPEEVEDILAEHDFIELEYRQMVDLRKRKKLKPEVRKRIAEHDEVERQIQQDPEAVFRTAYKDLDHGTTLLLKLIRSRKMTQRLLDIHGNLFRENDKAFDCLASRIDFLNRQLIRLARSKTPEACMHLWCEAHAYAKEFVRLALVYPEEFRSMAETSLTMPSLRGLNPKFTADAETIVKAIHLAEQHPAGQMTRDRDRIGELCGFLVANILDSIVQARQHFEREKRNVQHLQAFAETADAYRNITVEESLKHNLYPTFFEHVIASACLPEFREDPKKWWQKRVKPMLRDELNRIKKRPSRNQALWTELCVATDNGKDGAKWKVLHDNCRNKLNQFARHAGAKTFA